MVNHYILIINSFFLFQQVLKTFNYKINENYIPNSEKVFISKIDKINQSQGPNDEKDKPFRNPEYQNYPEGKDEDIIKKYERLLEREKELKDKYSIEYTKSIEQQNQLKVDGIYILLLIIIVCILFILIFIYSCYELYKYRKRKKKDIEISISKFNSLGKEFNKASSESSSSHLKNSTYESNKRNASSSQSQIDDLNNSSNFNILVPNKEQEEEIIIEPYNDGDEAPIQFYDNNNNNKVDKDINNNNNIINNNNYNDDVKTLTNDEDVYFASKTDKLLYKPYSNEEINK